MIFTKEQLLDLTEVQIDNLARYYHIDAEGDELIDKLLARINFFETEETPMSVRVKRANGGE